MPDKPLGTKSYGSIAHLSGSRLGPGDHHIHAGQEAICTVKARDKHDTITITEKLDGSNVGVAKIEGRILALTRAGYLATDSHYSQHHEFAAWVEFNEPRFDEVLRDGERICAEWLIQAHGTRYRLLHEPFVVFDLMRGKERAGLEERNTRLGSKFVFPALIGVGPMSVADAMRALGPYGFAGAIDPAEGVVYRVERRGEFDFMAKYVRPDKVDGKFLESVSGKPSVMNAGWLAYKAGREFVKEEA